MLKVKYNNQEYTIVFKQGLTHDNKEVWSDLNSDMREIFINLNTPVIELKKVFKALAIKIILLENKMLKHFSSEDIDKIASVLSLNTFDIDKITACLDCSFSGFFCTDFA